MGDYVETALLTTSCLLSRGSALQRKVEKRGRKLVDYDSHRHNYEALQNNTKKRDQAKITRQHEVLEEARRTFELMNNELYDELPALYDSRYETRLDWLVVQ